ncbi:TetR family transcriptional regulator [Nakamurella sp. YIM 132087]|uniref:TetR family transcriptional regulator n=1 Tax=Nakamurella alba TaxID=2665158 RepID=A0A7K1FMV5_9ACTN|nr:TetR/AcrR family transcriptional regulator [Nakamurella alba]MTD15501.1 TetR family transcriptional regulator [Nakamurella alba]
MPRRNLDRGAVVSAAAELADRDGFEVLSVSALARHLDVQPASLYSHVRNLADLQAGVHQLALASLTDTIGTEVAGCSGRDALNGMVGGYRQFEQEHPGLWAALQRPASEETARSAGAVRLTTLTAAVLRGYGIVGDEMVHATRFLGATVNGFLSLQRHGGFAHRPADQQTSWLRTVDALDTALRAWPTTIEGPRS